MANTLKTLQGELLVSEVEAIITDGNGSGPMNRGTRVIAISKTGGKYDIATNQTANKAAKILSAATEFVAGVGHMVFDPEQVN